MAIGIVKLRVPEPVVRPAAGLTPRQVAWWLAGVIAVLTMLSVAEQYIIHIIGRDDLEDFLIAVDLDAESNIPTWYGSVTLLASAVLLSVIASRTGALGGRFVGHWRALAVLFVACSIDEVARLHEHLGRLQSVWQTSGLFFFAWVIPGALVVTLLTALFARFMLHLPAATRRRFLWSAGLFVTGALVVEALGGWRAETMGMNNMTHSLIATAEEVLEMAGVACFLVALLRHLGDLDARPAPAVAGALAANGHQPANDGEEPDSLAAAS